MAQSGEAGHSRREGTVSEHRVRAQTPHEPRASEHWKEGRTETWASLCPALRDLAACSYLAHRRHGRCCWSPPQTGRGHGRPLTLRGSQQGRGSVKSPAAGPESPMTCSHGRQAQGCEQVSVADTWRRGAKATGAQARGAARLGLPSA